MLHVVCLSMGLGLAAMLALSANVQAAEPTKAQLWPGVAPVGDGKTEQVNVTITVHQPEHPNGTAVVICPGGGYMGLVSGAEGHGIAEWLNKHDITGIVLEYRLPNGRSYVPLLDAQRAIRMVRANAMGKADNLHLQNVKADRIGIIGFSAGGHVASTAGTHFDAGDAKSADPVEQVSSRPDFMILVYPVVTMGAKTHMGSRVNLLGGDPSQQMIDLFSNEKQVTDKTPPAFLAHAVDDQLVPIDNSRDFYKAMRAHHVQATLLELPNGGHGLNGYKGPSWDAWQRDSLKWLKQIKMAP